MEKRNDKSVDNFIPVKERIRIRNKQIISLYKTGMSMDDVVKAMQKLGYIVSKTTVFFSINGRYTKKKKERKKRKNFLIKYLRQ